MNLIGRIALVFFFFALLYSGNIALAQETEKITVHFFESETCAHCMAEDEFLKTLEEKYPALEVIQYPIYEQKSQEILIELARQHGAERFLGAIPITFIGDEYFVGFNNEETTGRLIESAIKNLLGDPSDNEQAVSAYLPIVGEINFEKYSLPILAVILGFLDGFNVCSLGALALILGLVLILGSRKRILLFGGIFILTTAVIYGLLIILWYKLFSLLTPFMRWFEIGIGLLGIIGAVFFFKQFVKFIKHGPTCEMTGSKTVASISDKVKRAFENPGNILTLSGVILLFAAVLTIVEFPCSAAIPVMFAGVLSKSSLPVFSYLLYISIFILFYMLDELIIFAIAVSKMRLWLTSSKLTVWITLAEALILGALGLYYLVNAI